MIAQRELGGYSEASGACVLCGGSSFTTGVLLRDNRTGAFSQWFRVSRCHDCGLVSLLDRPTGDELAVGYDHGYGPYRPIQPPAAGPSPRTALAERLRVAWHVIDGMATVDRLPVHGHTLDVGAGRGDDVMTLRRRGIDAIGLEPIASAVEAARQGGAPVVHGSLEDVDLDAGSFDVVLLNQVVEHFADPVAAMRRVGELLRHGGRVMVLTPNVDGLWAWMFRREWAHWHVPYHLHLFGPRQLRRLLDMCGFEVESVTTASPSFWLNLSLRARCHRSQVTGYILPRDEWQFPLPIRLALAPLGRLVDLFGAGDCLIAIGRRRSPHEVPDA